MRREGLTLSGSGGRTWQAANLLGRYDGEQILDEYWLADDADRGGLYLVADLRYRFGSQTDARNFLRDLQTSVTQGAPATDDLSDRVELGEQEFAYVARTTEDADSVYAVGFQSDTVVGYILMGAGETFSDEDALALAEAADR